MRNTLLFTLAFLTFQVTSAKQYSKSDFSTLRDYVSADSATNDSVTLSNYEWELFVFGSYYAEECEEEIADKDSIIYAKEDKIKYLKGQLTLKDWTIDTLMVVVEEKDGIISRGEKREKRKKIENGIIKGGGGVAILTLIGLYIWKEVTD